MIAGLEEISKGEMYIGGRLINDVPPKDRDIAMVFQSYALYPHMTVYKNIAFGLEPVSYTHLDVYKRQASRELVNKNHGARAEKAAVSAPAPMQKRPTGSPIRTSIWILLSKIPKKDLHSM